MSAESEDSDAAGAVHNQMRLPEFRSGRGGPQINSARTMNLFSRALRGLTNPKIVWGERDEAVLTDSNFVLNLSRDSAGGAGGGLASIKQYVLITHDSPDVFLAQQFDGATSKVSGSVVAIAKPYELRQGPFDGKTAIVRVEAWDGATFSNALKSFQFAYKSSTYRLATDLDTSQVEKQTIVPRFIPAVTSDGLLVNDCATVIYAVKCSGLGGESKLLALSDGRAWCRSTA